MTQRAQDVNEDALLQLIRSGKIAEADEETRRRYYEYRLATDPDLRRRIADAEEAVRPSK